VEKKKKKIKKNFITMWTFAKITIIGLIFVFEESHGKLFFPSASPNFERTRRLRRQVTRPFKLDPNFLGPDFSFGALTGETNQNCKFCKGDVLENVDSSKSDVFLQDSTIKTQTSAGGNIFNHRSKIGTAIGGADTGTFFSQESSFDKQIATGNTGRKRREALAPYEKQSAFGAIVAEFGSIENWYAQCGVPFPFKTPDFENKDSQVGEAVVLGGGSIINQGSQFGLGRKKRRAEFFNVGSSVGEAIVAEGGSIENQGSQIGTATVFSGGKFSSNFSQVRAASAAQGAKVQSLNSQFGKQNAFGNDKDLAQFSKFSFGRKKREPQFENKDSQVGEAVVFSGGSIKNQGSNIGKASASQGGLFASISSQIGKQVAFGNDKDLAISTGFLSGGSQPGTGSLTGGSQPGSITNINSQIVSQLGLGRKKRFAS